MRNFYIFLGIFFSVAITRFIPHPPNFTSLLALSFYVPALLGIRYLTILLISFAVTDFIIGYHFNTHWTWGSVLLIGLMSVFFKKSFTWRVSGALIGAIIFFLITNFGVWITGQHGLNFLSLKTTYILAIPFFTNSLMSTMLFSFLIEAGYKIFRIKLKTS